MVFAASTVSGFFAAPPDPGAAGRAAEACFGLRLAGGAGRRRRTARKRLRPVPA